MGAKILFSSFFLFMIISTVVTSNTDDGDDCQLGYETGTCRGSYTRYYWNSTTMECQKFIYGGCGGNENKFETIEDCNNKCNPYPDACKLEPVTGLCKAYIPSYFWNETAKECQKFIYGGCGGNSNRFATIDSCNDKCNPYPEACSYVPVTGLCLAYFPSYFWNETAVECQKFIYGGCGGNENRFPNEELCNDKCNPYPAACDLKPEVGPCRASIPSYYWNAEKQKCMKFNYGGCKGNANRFSTLKACQNACGGKHDC